MAKQPEGQWRGPKVHLSAIKAARAYYKKLRRAGLIPDGSDEVVGRKEPSPDIIVDRSSGETVRVDDDMGRLLPGAIGAAGAKQLERRIRLIEICLAWPKDRGVSPGALSRTLNEQGVETSRGAVRKDLECLEEITGGGPLTFSDRPGHASQFTDDARLRLRGALVVLKRLRQGQGPTDSP